mmetsp:Transcript_2731/g.3713  ORF Transcript_2731/g.3713 Transcript_2731/m.3713 type:complete len:239 (+) Transcript_2731:324-1040(+)
MVSWEHRVLEWKHLDSTSACREATSTSASFNLLSTSRDLLMEMSSMSRNAVCSSARSRFNNFNTAASSLSLGSSLARRAVASSWYCSWISVKYSRVSLRLPTSLSPAWRNANVILTLRPAVYHLSRAGECQPIAARQSMLATEGRLARAARLLIPKDFLSHCMRRRREEIWWRSLVRSAAAAWICMFSSLLAFFMVSPNSSRFNTNTTAPADPALGSIATGACSSFALISAETKIQIF